ncbi:DUF86 domain-containing protein [Moorella naiadis]|uniref:type VII toxin-antitoxin system HepT family RNase toxin n=1 Tax=Moorella naiadis (nom. illeg.) TaxID=3093670 RepID=UPI003D9C9933
MVNPLVVSRKLQKLKQYLAELETMRDISLEDYLQDFRYQRIVERLLQLIVDVAVDINTHAVVDAGNPPPADAFSSFEEAAKIGLISSSLARRLAPSTGERNVIIHEYEAIDNTIVYGSIDEALKGYRRYLSQVERYLQSHSDQ